MRIVRNERSWAIELISHINTYLGSRTLQIARAGGESTINTTQNVMFPDVLLYGDISQTQILQGWEVKLPDVLITDTTFIQDAIRKAETLGLSSTFIWNFTHGVLYTKDARGTWQLARQWNSTSHIRTREDVNTYRSDWETLINEIILDLNGFLERGEILPTSLGEVISESIMTTLISRNKEIVARHLELTASRDRMLGISLNQWWAETKLEFIRDERAVYGAFAKTILLNWINRISFAHTIKRHHSPAATVENIDENMTPIEANELFEEISKQCDFYTIFRGVEHNEFIPTQTWTDLVGYNNFLTQQGIAQYDQQSLQGILESSIKLAKREAIGQFTTPPILADLLAKSVINNLDDNVIDPCCGSGTIAKATLELKQTGLSQEEAYDTTWASDKFSFPLQIANIGLTNFDSINIASRVFQSNVFNLEVGQAVDMVNPSTGELMHLEIPLFDTILSNLPFVPFESISDDEKEFLRRTSENVLDHTGVQLGRRSDLYTYILAHLWSIVKDNGKIGIIISNSWLGTQTGRIMYRVMRELFEIERVVISKNGRWFRNAQVVTTIVILKKKSTIGDTDDYNTKFATLNVPLSSLAEENIMSQAADSILIGASQNEEIINLVPYSQSSIDKLLDLKISINALFHNVEWLLEIEDKLINITDQFSLRRGERRGWDAMFYPRGDHGIEPEYLKPVLLRPGSITTLQGEVDGTAFCCSRSIDELEALGHTGAINWIRRFEDGVNNVGKPLISSLRRANHYWYELKDNLIADIVTAQNPSKRLFYSHLTPPAFFNQRLTGLRATENNRDLDLSFALINSVIGMFYLEAVGFARGLGALDLSKTNLQNSMMLNPDLLSEDDALQIKEAFVAIRERDVFTMEEEIEQEDRIYFEETVLRAFGIDESFLPKIKDSLLSLQRTRLSIH